MAIQKGVYASALVSRVLDELSDSGQNRWSSAVVLGYVNDGIDALAQEFVFRKTEIIPTVANKGHYATQHEIARLISLVYGGAELEPATEDDLYKRVGSEWHSLTGTPEFYFVTPQGVRIVPAPQGSGSTPAVVSTPSITETQGATLQGSGYNAFLNGTTVHNFLDGDGTASNTDATDQLRVKFNYYPTSIDTNTLVPTRYVTALLSYAKARCLASSEAPEEVQQAAFYKSEWEAKKYDAATYAKEELLNAGLLMTSTPDIRF